MLMLFLTVALVHIIALMSPGPDFLCLTNGHQPLAQREAMMGVLGITCGVMVWAGVALLGLNLILARMAWLHSALLWSAGACIYAGWATRCCVAR
ncbi:LysE family transporter [Klebsiella pneumoniae subsp. pneumoniae]|nr:LysE family transporter [Klebsiella pneumoniae subsp. pneumoniae]